VQTWPSSYRPSLALASSLQAPFIVASLPHRKHSRIEPNPLCAVALHQSLYARIQSLHAEADSLDSQIKKRFQVLVDCRKELISIPAATVPLDSREVSADEVLRMGNRISKFTTPPAFRPTLAKESKGAELDVDAINGTAASAAHSPLQQVPKPEAGKENDIYAGLPTESRAYLEDRDRHLREVWKNHPSDNVVRSGLLMVIQQMLDRGLDPANLTSEQKNAEAQRLAEEEEQRHQKEAEEERKRRESAKASGQSRTSISQPTQAPEDSGFDLFDPDDED